jgi:hypothetical protein
MVGLLVLQIGGLRARIRRSVVPRISILWWGAVCTRPNVDRMLGIMRLVLACGLYLRERQIHVQQT